ncbi:MAG: TonB-dependent receptor [Pseudomonadota bacterium]
MFRKTLLVRALGMAFGATALTFAVAPAIHAQTSATGTVFGQVDNPSGATVVIENVETGARRTMTPGADGKYSATSMPVGSYRVLLVRNGATVTTRDGVEVTIGGGSEVSFAAATLQTVQVVGRKQTIDVSAVGSTTTFSSTELARLPVASNVGAVIQLAPQTTRGDSRYGGGGAPSMGGSSASENAYYINGFPVTTLLTQVGFSQLPFNSISQAQILTGGYGAEFGRSTGGVVNLVTKRGGNDLVFGLGFSLEPSGLRAKPKSSYYQDNGANTITTNGKYRFYNEENKQETMSESFYFGGPLVKDKLFFFVAAENIDVTRSGIRLANAGGAGTTNSVLNAAWQETAINKPRALLKLDWNITDAHHLEYTKIYDQVDDTRRYYSFDYNTLTRGTVQQGGVTYANWGPTPVASEQGSGVDILKYTGYLTNDLTLTALVGETRSPHRLLPTGYNPALPQISATDGRIPGFTYPQPQTAVGNVLTPGAVDTNKGARIDLEWRLNSKHTLRAGIDYNKIESVAGTAQAGGTLWTYGQTNPAVALPDSVPTNTVVGNPYAQQGYYVSQSIINSQSTPSVIQSAWYLEDRFQVTDRVLLSLGLRNEAFDNRNGDGDSYIKITKQLAPRLGATWDVNGDASFKMFANAGRYHVPVPTNVAIRGAGSSRFTQQNFVYTGVDPITGAPTGLTEISPVFSNNNEFGQAKDPRQVAAQNMKGNYQDELQLGFEKALSRSLTVGAKLTYRTLRTAIDDTCDYRPFEAWATRNGKDGSDFHNVFQCALFNPGEANTFTIDVDGDGVLDTVNLSKADLGYPTVKRKYLALDLSAEYPFDGKLWGKVNYTWSRNTGNTEGQLLSDIGQGDVSTTQAFDFPEFSINADGRLPNNRTHQLKAFGYYQVTPEIGFGANLLVASGRPRNCIGNPSAAIAGGPADGYGSAFFFCNGVASPRGSAGNLPPDVRMDLNLAYRPRSVPGLQLKVDVFNAFNRQSVEVVEERYNAPGGSEFVWSRYGHVESYTAPRYVKLSATYDYKF